MKVDVRDEEAASWARYFELMDRCVADLVDGYPRLAALVAAGSGAGAGGDAEGRRGTRVVAGVPIRVEVVDAQARVRALVARYGPLARGTLRMGPGGCSGGTVAALRFLGGALRRLREADPALADELADALWATRRLVRGLTSTDSRPYRLAAPCGGCGVPSVWVSPDAARMRCSSCGAVTSLSVSVLAASAGQGRASTDVRAE